MASKQEQSSEATAVPDTVENYVGGAWTQVSSDDGQAIVDPATREELAHITFSSPEDVDDAVRTASEAFEEWRRTPAVERSQYLFDLKAELDDRVDSTTA